MKFTKMQNMLKNKTDPKKEEKILGLEEKKSIEVEELLKEFNTKKNEGLGEIKERYNTLSKQIKVDALAIAEALKKSALINVSS